MITVNNLKVNRKAVDRIHRKNNGKKRFLRLVATATVVTIVASGAVFSANKIKENMDENQIKIITQYYGEDSVEKKIIDYIGVSERLQALDLDKYKVDNNLYSKYGIGDNLFDPSSLNDFIDRFNEMPSYISTKDITRQDTNVFLTLLLKKQEQLVNQYIYKYGYSTAHKDVTMATKKYTAETFGIENPEDITLSYYTTGGEETLRITKETGAFSNENYVIDGFFDTKNEREIKDGVVHMVNTDTYPDPDKNDNSKYNRKRNIYIKDALEKSVELEKEINNNDLYDSKLAGKLK